MTEAAYNFCSKERQILRSLMLLASFNKGQSLVVNTVQISLPPPRRAPTRDAPTMVRIGLWCAFVPL